jgi:carbon monoxide dehydrogenase subunit G
MRTLFGIVLGVGMTVGAAYVHDNLSTAQSVPGMARTIVNWDVAAEVTGNAMRVGRQQIDRLLGK